LNVLASIESGKRKLEPTKEEEKNKKRRFLMKCGKYR
jgi:hypothetical protein